MSCDIFGTPLGCSERSRQWRADDDEKWTTHLTLSSRSQVEKDGLLHCVLTEAQRLLVGRSPVRWYLQPSRDNSVEQASLSDADVRRLLCDDNVVLQHHKDEFYNAMTHIAAAYPYIIVVLEKCYASKECDFAGAVASTDDGLKIIRAHAANTEKVSIAVPLVDEKDEDYESAVESAQEDDNEELDEEEDKEADEKEDADDDIDDKSDYKVPNKKKRLASSALDNSAAVDAAVDASVDNNVLPHLDKRARLDLQREFVCTRICVYLNDSALGDLLRLAQGPERRSVFRALEMLQSLQKKFLYNMSPRDIGLEPLIPPLGAEEHFRLTLFPFQRRTVHWMLRSEWEGVCGTTRILFQERETVKWHNHPAEYSKHAIQIASVIAPDHSNALEVRGGICCGPTGTGKTTSMIALIFLQSRLEAQLPRIARLPHHWHLADNRLPSLRAKFERSGSLFYANCTLVIAPQQVVQQWYDEFVKTLGDGVDHHRNDSKKQKKETTGGNPNIFAIQDTGGNVLLRIGVVKDFVNAKALSLVDVMERLDVLIVSKKIFTSTNYRQSRVSPAAITSGLLLNKGLGQYKYMYDGSGRRADDELLNRVVHANIAAAAKTDPSGGAVLAGASAGSVRLGEYFEGLVLHAVHWRRIITDEMHELDKKWSMIERAVATLHADHVWGLTATPEFASAHAFRNPKGEGGYSALMRVDAGREHLIKSVMARWYFVNRCTTTSSLFAGESHNSLDTQSASPVGDIVVHDEDVANVDNAVADNSDIAEDVAHRAVSSSSAVSSRNCSNASSNAAASTTLMPALHMHRVEVQMTAVEMAIYLSLSQDDALRRLLFCSHHVLDQNREWLQGGAGAAAAAATCSMSVSAVAEAMQADRVRSIDNLRNERAAYLASYNAQRKAFFSQIDSASPFLARIRKAYYPAIEPIFRFLRLSIVTIQTAATYERRLDALCGALQRDDGDGGIRADAIGDAIADTIDDLEEDDNVLIKDNVAVSSTTNSKSAAAKIDEQNALLVERAKQMLKEQAAEQHSLYKEFKRSKGACWYAKIDDNNDNNESDDDNSKEDQDENDGSNGEEDSKEDSKSSSSSDLLVRGKMAVQARAECASLSELLDDKRKQLNEAAQKLARCSQRLRDVTAQHHFFEAVFRRLCNRDELLECMICLDEAPTAQQVALTVCGHEFCKDCALAHFAHNAYCPKCRRALSLPADLRIVDRFPSLAPDAAGSAAGAQDSAQDNVAVSSSSSAATTTKKEAVAIAGQDTSKYGSKLKRLVELIFEVRARPDFAKMIVFAQFDRLLHLIGDALAEFSIEFVYVQGSIRQCESALRRFRTDPAVQIMLLSSETTISGVNLVEANHIIAVHPAYGGAAAVLGQQQQPPDGVAQSRGRGRRARSAVSGEDDDSSQGAIMLPKSNNDDIAYAKMWQAIGRIRRLTQTRPCHAWSLVTTGTIEEQMYAQQIEYAKSKHQRERNIFW